MFELVKRNSRPNMLRTLDLMGRDFDEMGKLMDNLFHFHGVPTLSGVNRPAFSPALNFVDKKDKYTATLELPGMTQDDVDISIDDNDVLTISGEKKVEQKEDGDDYCVREFCYGSFRREIPVPHNIDKEKINATFDNGILKLDFPKVEIEEEKSVKKISIQKK